MHATHKEHTDTPPLTSPPGTPVQVRGKRVLAKPGSVIICGACSLAIPDHRWGEHRESCWGFAHQNALLDELREDVAVLERAEDLRRRYGRLADIPMVPCSTCGAQPGELCVSRDARAMAQPHKRRRELMDQLDARTQDD